MTTNLPATAAPAEIAAIESALVGGDLAKLTATQRVLYYNRTCESLGLNPLTKPFAYLALNGKLVLYATRDCTDQLRSVKAVSITDLAPQQIGDLYVVRAAVKTPDGRTDAATGAVCIEGLRGEKLANAMMKAETKAKRRATLSICGLGLTDESEVESIEGAVRIDVEPQPESPKTNGTPRTLPPNEHYEADQDPGAYRLQVEHKALKGKSLTELLQADPKWFEKALAKRSMLAKFPQRDQVNIEAFAAELAAREHAEATRAIRKQFDADKMPEWGEAQSAEAQRLASETLEQERGFK